jgi:hypothetical protein
VAKIETTRFLHSADRLLHTDIGAPEGIRTPDLRLRRPLLYPAELLAQVQRARSSKQSAGRSCYVLSAYCQLLNLVGARRFELPTPCAQGRCATRLRYAPSLTTVILHSDYVKSRFYSQVNQRWQDLREPF